MTARTALTFGTTSSYSLNSTLPAGLPGAVDQRRSGPNCIAGRSPPISISKKQLLSTGQLAHVRGRGGCPMRLFLFSGEDSRLLRVGHGAVRVSRNWIAPEMGSLVCRGSAIQYVLYASSQSQTDPTCRHGGHFIPDVSCRPPRPRRGRPHPFLCPRHAPLPLRSCRSTLSKVTRHHAVLSRAERTWAPLLPRRWPGF